MVRLPAAVIVWLLVLTVAPPAAQAPPSAERLFVAYLAGDPSAISRTIRTRQDYRAFSDGLQRLIDSWKAGRPAPGESTMGWSPTHAGFVFATATVVLGLDPSAGARLVNAACDLTTMRPNGPAEGRPDAFDRFEVALHRAAIAALSPFSQGPFANAEGYLARIEGRIAALSRLPGGDALTARLALARGLVLETATRPLAADALPPIESRFDVPRQLDEQARASQQRDAVIAAYLAAERLPEVAAEARVRRAMMLHRKGDQARALEVVDRGLLGATDPVVRYWGALVRGRVLQATGRLGPARAAYEQAAAAMPTAQTPAVALAAVLIQLDDRVGAESWAAAARAGRSGTSDPWWYYWFADLRSMDALMAQIVGAR